MPSPLIRNAALPPAVEEGRQKNMQGRYHSPINAERAMHRIRNHSPVGMTIVSPASSIISGISSPSRKQMIDMGRLPPTTSQRSARSRHSRTSIDREQTEEEVKVLRERFNLIQQGLGSIDQERALLVGKANKLENERLALEQQLELRDKEIHALVKRCASQEEKMREYSKLRAENRGLTNELQNMLAKIESYEEDSVDLHSLRLKLKESEAARQELQERLDWVQKEHKYIAETLSNSLENVKRLTEEKQVAEDERRIERKRAEMEIEKQRLTTIQVENDYRAELEIKQQQIDQMELYIQQGDNAVKKEARELLETERHSFLTERESLESQLGEMQRLLDYEINRKEQETLESLESERKSFEIQLADMQKDIKRSTEEKQVAEDERRIERKRAEMEIEKQRLTTIQVENDYRAELEIKQQQIDQMELYIQQGDNSIIEARESLETEKRSFLKEKQEAKGSIERERKSFEIQLEDIQNELNDQIKRKERDTSELLESERKSFEAQLEDMQNELNSQIKRKEQEARSFESEKKSFESQIAEMQKQLDDQVEAESNKKFNEMKKEMESMMEGLMATHEHKVSKMQNQINQQVADFDSNNGVIDKKFAVMKDKLEEKDIQMNELEQEFSEQMEELMKKQVTLDKTEEERKVLAAQIENLKHLGDEHDALVQYLEIMDSNMAELTAENGILVVEKENLTDEKKNLEERLLNLEHHMIGREGELQGRFQAERAQLQTEVEKAQDEVASLQIELKKRQSWVVKMENELNESRRRIAEKEDKILAEQKEKGKVRRSLEASLNQAKEEISRLEYKVSNQEQNIVSLEDKLEWEKTIQAQRSDAEEEIESLAKALQEETEKAESLEKKCNELVDLEDKLRVTNAKLAKLEEELQRVNQEGKELTERLEAELEEKAKQASLLEKRADGKKEDIQSLVVELDRMIEELSKRDSRIVELEEGLKESLDQQSKKEEYVSGLTIDLEQKAKEISDLQATRIELELLFSTEEKKVLKLERKVESLLGSSQDMAGELDKTSARLEEEAVAWTEKEQIWKETRMVLEGEKKSYKGKYNDSLEEVYLLEQELERRQRKIGSMEDEINSLNNNRQEEAFIESEKQRMALEGQLSELRRQSKEMTQNIDSKEMRLLSLEQDIEKCRGVLVEKDETLEETLQKCNYLEDKAASLERQLASREEHLMRVDEHLDGSINDIQKKEAEILAMKRSIAKKDADLEEAIMAMRNERASQSQLEENLCDCQTKNSEYEELLGKQADKVSLLQEEIESITESKKQRTAELEKKIRKMRTEMALKDDEIRDLKMVDLKDAEEEIASLRSSLEAKGKLESELSGKITLLKESQSVIDELVQKQSMYQQREQDYFAECERLVKSESDAKLLLETRESDNQTLMARVRKSAEMNLRKSQDSRDKEISNLSAELHVTNQNLKKTENTLKERSTLLAEVVGHNKELESKLGALQKKVSGLEDETKEDRLDLDTKRAEITQLRKEYLEKETCLKKQLKEERKNREVLEDTLEKMKRHVTDATKYKTQCVDLEKITEALKDKVKRQETYMQKKLQQEKIASGRVSLSTPIKSAATPSMRKQPSKTGARKRLSGIPSLPHSNSSSSSSTLERTPSRRSTRSRLPTPSGGVGFKSPGIRGDLD